MVAGGEAADVADVAEHGSGHNRTDTVDAGDRGSGCGDRAAGATFDLAALVVEAGQISDQVAGQLEFRLCHRGIGDDAVQGLGRLSDRELLLTEPAGHQFAQHGVTPAQQLGA